MEGGSNDKLEKFWALINQTVARLIYMVLSETLHNIFLSFSLLEQWQKKIRGNALTGRICHLTEKNVLMCVASRNEVREINRGR